jgi:hypothetical protein
MENYKVYWTDMHSNLHHEKIADLPRWIEQIRKQMDFWPFAYYPYYMKKDKSGMGVEDVYSIEEVQKDWEYIRTLTETADQEGFPMFMGYEWQGSGEDGDHNVFFFDNDENPAFPLRYRELVERYKGIQAIGIPHHLAYQLGFRGKNWATQDDQFSPFVEIYSSHGSSESDETSIPMDRHVHMGPRTGTTCVEHGWDKGYQFGVIASGDNHNCPGIYGNGYCAVLAKSNSKEDIWDAMINRRVYGVSKNRIDMDFTIDGSPMGAVIKQNKKATLKLKISAGDAIDRIELVADNRVIEMIPHTSTWENNILPEKVKFKFRLELGWGPDTRVFPDITSRKWSGSLCTKGRILSIEKCWSNFGQNLTQCDDHSCEFEMTTYKSTGSGKWMGSDPVATEGFIFEIEDDIKNTIILNIDGIEYELPVKDILENGRLIPLLDEAHELIKERYGLEEYYRQDSWWHNCYKIKLHKGIPEDAYTRTIERTIDMTGYHQVRCRIWQKNGGIAWSSPIFITE